MAYIIDFKKDTSVEQINSYFLQNSLTVLSIFNNFELVYLAEGSTLPPQTDIIESVIDDSTQNIAPLNYIYTAPTDIFRETSFDINQEQNWWKAYSLIDINFDQTQDTNKRKGKNTKVYILDSGIDDSHPEFLNTSVQKLFSFTNDFTDTSGHGTAIASVISGETCGLTDSTIKVVKIFDVNVPTKLSDLLKALDTVASDFISSPDFGSVVNISWSIPKNIYVEQKIELLINMGLMVVCSAGNNGSSIEDVTPACMPAVLTIGSYNQDFLPCNFSNYTSDISLTNDITNFGELDGWAPGVSIYAATLNQGYGYIAGTSISAAIASGALVYNISKIFSNDQGVPISDLTTGTILNNTFSREYISKLTLYRTGLLTLEGNYASSINKVVSYINRIDNVNSIGKLTSTPIIGMQKGKENNQLIFLYDNIKTIECTTDLPPGLSFSLGWLRGDPNVDLEGKQWKKLNFEFKITLMNDDVRISNVTLFVTDLDNHFLSLPDPDLQITLQELPGCKQASCGGCFQVSPNPDPYCNICGSTKLNQCFCSSIATAECP